MGVRVTVGSGEQHPEGWYALKIMDSELAQGKFGSQVKFTLKSSQKDEAGQAFKLSYFTSTTCNPTTKLGGLFEACGLPLQVGLDLDTDVLEGMVIDGRVEHKAGDKGTFANVVEVRARPTVKEVMKALAPPPPPKQATEPTEEGYEDPFADE